MVIAMTEFRKDLNKLLRQKEIKEYIDKYNRGLMCMDEVLQEIKHRARIERLKRSEKYEN